MGIFGCVIKSICETVFLSDTKIGGFLRYHSAYERQQRLLKEEEILRKHRAAKQDIFGTGVKQIGMAIEMESRARELEKK